MSNAILWNPLRDAHLLALRNAGRPWPLIARDLGIGRSAAIERARKIGIAAAMPPPPKPKPMRQDRPALPAGHPIAWAILNEGTVLAGEPYPHRIFL